MIAVTLLALSFALQTQPPRDARRSASGAASIRGRVMSDESRPRPLRRARVTLSRGPVDLAENAITEDDGSFTFSSVPAGRYTLAVAKEGYVPMMYGARRPARPGTPIDLHEREVKELTVRLPPGSVITGLITDAAGQPVQGAAVSAFASTFDGATGERRLALAGQTASTSDDRGEYRIYGLAAGEYFISVQPLIADPGLPSSAAPEFRISNPRGRAVAPVPVFFPSTTDGGRAQPIAVGVGEERDGIDIRCENVPLASIGGVAAAPPRAGPTNVTLTRTGDSQMEYVRIARADQTGQFMFAAVPPGRYTVFAQAGTVWGNADIVVDGDDIPNLGIVMVPTLTISGRLLFEGASAPPSPAPLPVPLSVRPPVGRLTLPAPELRLGASGAFTISGVTAGTYGLFTQGLRTPIAGWWLQSAVVDGRDLLDAPLEVRASMSDLVVTLAPRASEIAGTVRDSEGRMTAGGFVVAFSTDRRSWFFNSRRVVGARPDEAGRFSILNLPPGEYFLTAVADLSDGEWYDASVLEPLIPGCARVTIAGAEKKTVVLDRVQ